MDYSKFLGTWMNTYRSGHVIDQFKLIEENGTLMIQVQVSGTTNSWGRVPAKIYVAANMPDKIAGFEVLYDLEASRHLLSINENKGLLVAAGFHNDKKNTDRQPYFSREFFYKT